jgi:hypothetical protein
MVYCLSKAELSEFLDYCHKNKAPTIEGLSSRIESATLWLEELSALTYLFSHIVENRLESGLDCDELISLYYDLEKNLWLEIQNFDLEFIGYLLHNLTNNELDLEEELIDCQRRRREFYYAKNLRY